MKGTEQIMYLRPQHESSGTVLDIDSLAHTKFKETKRYNNTEEKVMLCCRWASQREHSNRIAGVTV